jgi:hypothetical protein
VGVGFGDERTGEEAFGFLRFLDLSVDISSFLADSKDKEFIESVLSCLKFLFVPELERFCSLAQKASPKPTFTDNIAVDAEQKKAIFSLWRSMDTKLHTAIDLMQLVRRNRLGVRASDDAIRTYGSGVMMLQIAREVQLVAGQLTRADAERVELGDRLKELEIAERVLSRFESTEIERRARGRSAVGRQVRTRGGARLSLSDATLRAVQAHGGGATANDVMQYLAREFGMRVRPNHLALALQRHLRAGRLENIDQKWWMPYSAREYLQLGA